MAKARSKAPKLKDKEYRLANGLAPLSTILKTGGKGNLLMFDGTKNRAIRHCRNERSIFVDEQSEHAVLEPIVIESGYLRVPGREVITQEFLDAHPDNVANGGKLFYEVDEEKEASEALKYEDLVLDLKSSVREVEKTKEGHLKLQALVAVIKGSAVAASKTPKSALRSTIFAAIDENPYRFADENGNPDIFNETTTRRYLALTALAADVIRTSGDGRSLIWSKGGQVITNVPSGVKPTDHLFEFLETDEGILVLEEMQKRM